MTTVVKIQRKNGEIIQDCDVYIGRTCTRGGWDLPQSKWHNPFKGPGAVELYEQYILASPLINEIEELRGKRLGCWCKPQPCHGDVLVKILRERSLKLNVISNK